VFTQTQIIKSILLSRASSTKKEEFCKQEVPQM